MIDNTWTIQDILLNIEVIKRDYLRLLTSFCYFDRKEKLNKLKDFKKQIYSLNIYTSQKDKIWCYLNNDELDEPLQYLIKGYR